MALILRVFTYAHSSALQINMFVRWKGVYVYEVGIEFHGIYRNTVQYTYMTTHDYGDSIGKSLNTV